MAGARLRRFRKHQVAWARGNESPQLSSPIANYFRQASILSLNGLTPDGFPLTYTPGLSASTEPGTTAATRLQGTG